MSNNIIFGKYYSVNSKIHKLHPFAKLICTLTLILSLVFTNSCFFLFLFLLLFIGMIWLSKIPWKLYVQNFLKMKAFLIALIIVNTIFSGNFWEGLFVVTKMIMMITASSLLLFTTSVSEMLIGLRMLLKPLNYIHISSIKIVYSLSMALRFIPILLEQAGKILKSQYSRGLDFSNLKWKEKVFVLKSIVFPMFSLSFRRADRLAEAMEVRLFSFSDKRTNYRDRKMKKSDALITAIFVVLLFIIMIFEVFL